MEIPRDHESESSLRPGRVHEYNKNEHTAQHPVFAALKLSSSVSIGVVNEIWGYIYINRRTGQNVQRPEQGSTRELRASSSGQGEFISRHSRGLGIPRMDVA